VKQNQSDPLTAAGYSTDPVPPDGHETPLAAEARKHVELARKAAEAEIKPPSQTRTIVVANQKGGVGKTTTTVNVAAALALKGLSVVVLDLDPQGNACTALNVPHREGTAGTYEVLVEGAAISEVIVPCPDVAGLDVMPATIDLAGAEIEMVSLVRREYRLADALQKYVEQRRMAGGRIDYVLIDCPPSLGLLTLNSMVAADEVLIPIQAEYYALEGLGQLMRNVDLIKSKLNPKLTVSAVVLTMYDGRTNLSAAVAEEVRNHFGDTVLRTMVPRSVRVSEAPSFQQSVLTYDPTSTGSLSYQEVAREISRKEP
jgi:chromosome partitioning protein